MKNKLLIMLAFFSLAFNNAYGQIQLSVGEKYQCFLEDYANRYYDWVNISWSVDNGLYEDFSGSYVRTVSFHEYKSGTYKVTVNWTETDLSDPYDPFRHKSHTWYFTCKNDIIPVTKITLNYSILVLTNSPAQLTATVYPSNATNKNVSWESSNPSVATVSSNGLVTPVSAGEAAITCKAVDGSGVTDTCFVTVLPAVNIDINATNFPDENFRNFILSQSYGQDGILTASEINNVSKMDVKLKKIRSLKGIEYFAALTELNCSCNFMDSLDMSKNLALRSLHCDMYNLKYLNVSKNAALEWLYCCVNELQSLDVSKNTALIGLYCWSNQLTSLDVSKNTSLEYLQCMGNKLTSLNLSKNASIKNIRCENNQIRGTAMDNLISSLPQNTTSYRHEFCVVDPGSNYDNVCTKTQVAAVKTRGWFPCYYSNKNYCEYEGSVLVTEIILNKTSLSLEIGKSDTLKATVRPDDASFKTVTWTSNSTNVAIVDGNGKVTAKAKGTAKITCTAIDGSGVKATCTVTVTDPTPADPTSISIRSSLSMKPTDTYKLTYSYGYPTGTLSSQEVTPSVTWTSNDTTVATVSTDGTVTAKAVGAATIMVKSANNLTANCNVTVIQQPNLPQWDIKQIDAHCAFHSMILNTDGTLWAWGYNNHGQLGDGTTTNCYFPKQIMTGVENMSCDWHTMILKTDGTLWACGYNKYGQLGDGTTTDISTPKPVMSGVASVSAGGYHTMILKTDGSLWACGRNNYGQLGDGTTIDCSIPKQIMTGVSAVSAGGYYTMILKTDGSLWKCGGFYRNGNVTPKEWCTPEQVMTGVAAVSAGYEHTMILKTDGSLWACGNNSRKQLGDSTTTSNDIPKYIMDDVAAVSAGGWHTMIIKTDGSLLACGDNRYGQLGDATTIDRSSPILVMNNVKAVSAGQWYTIILKTDGTLWACGDNSHGTLGDGTNIDRHTPVIIAESDISHNEKGDVNEDGSVNGTDLVALTNIILGKNPEKPTADVNGDGYVNGTDYVSLANIILGISNARRMTDIGEGQETCNAALNIEPFAISAGERKELSIGLTNPDDALTLLQFDLQLPKGLTIAKAGDDYLVDMSGRTNRSNHQLSVYGNDHHARFLLASSKNNLIAGTEGAVIRLTVTADADFHGGAIALYDILGVSPDEQEVNMPDCQFSLVGGATGIYCINGNQEASEIYSLSGQRQSAMKKGINIVGGKKIIK